MSEATLPDPATGIEVTPAQVSDLLPAVRRGEIALVDCREDDEWRICRIEGALLVPLSRFAEATPPEIPVIVYCHHGMRSLRAATYWRQRGAEAWSMSGGIDQWSAEIDPSVPVY
ncbi:rhodanese-like domain-containing protein [Luteolibacter flavescens]|uniref:Rhodanese-like domain-containing protein n=1 Tax=Luteolibacter flavescens TaxID=1859460 RepID=A0ABT3FLW0_9BACT|nr:rhodanese-like domain-containing protein [Luteolibacter flavescens]MCW1884553.1 rhodanese-like domain-containing protein [Luteolibacter flavescens]